ncbi:MAG: TrmH family RNA methyltransferase [Planctomycetota bacterium]
MATLLEQRINDRADPRIAAFRDVRDADLRGRDGLFCVESPRIVHRFLHALIASAQGVPCAPRVHLDSLLLSPETAAFLRPLIDALPSACTAHDPLTIFLAEEHLLSELAGYRMHQGALALGVRPVDASITTLLQALPAGADLIATCGVVHTDNIGGLFRSAGSFGGVGVLLGDGSSDPLHRKAIRVSSGRVFSVPWAETANLESDLRSLRKSGFALIAAEDTPSALPIDEALLLPKIESAARRIVVLGAEGSGVPTALQSLCDVTACIPMRDSGGLLHEGDRPSLNVAIASAVFLHGLCSTRRHARARLHGRR